MLAYILFNIYQIISVELSKGSAAIAAFIFTLFCIAPIGTFFFSFQPLERKSFGFLPSGKAAKKLWGLEQSYLSAFLSKKFPTSHTFLYIPAFKFTGKEIAESSMVRYYINSSIPWRLYTLVNYLYIFSFPAIALLCNLAVYFGFVFWSPLFLGMIIFFLLLYFPSIKYACVILSLDNESGIFNANKYNSLSRASFFWAVLVLLDVVGLILYKGYI